MSLQLYLNGQLCDLSQDSAIALTFQINNLADVKNQQGNTSNQFKLPLTQNNRRILGYPDDIKFTTNIPYTQMEAKIIDDGIEIVPNGIGEISDCDEDNANITVLSGNVDFFDTISPQLYDMGDSTTDTGKKQSWLPYQHLWNLENVVNSRQNTTGYIWPVIDYGNLNTDEPLTIDIRQMRPGFYIKTAIDLIVANAGYTATGSLLSNPLYPLLVAQFSNSDFEHGTDYQNQPDVSGLSAYQSQQIQFDRIAQIVKKHGTVNFNTITADKSNQFTGSNTFTAAIFNDVLITVKMPHVYLRGYVTPVERSTKFRISIMYHQAGHPVTDDDELAASIFTFDGNGEKKSDGSGDPKGWTRLNGSSGGNLFASIDILNSTLSVEAQIEQGDSVYIAYGFDDATRAPATAIMFPNVTLDIVSQKQDVHLNQLIQCERIFPDIAQKDLLKDTLQRFGIICQTDNTKKQINFVTFKDIIGNIPIAKDWTKKCVNQGKNVAFQLGSYSQVNNLIYKQDDAITAGYADDAININDKTLSATAQTIIESQFAPSLNTSYLPGTSTAQIKMIDITTDSLDFSIGVSPRILIIEQLNLFTIGTGVSIKFTDGTSDLHVNDVISTGYFYKETGQYNLCWINQPNQPGLREIYYPELEKILKQTKVVNRYVMLTPRDIVELDLTIPIYLEQDNAYYYINKINAWQKGKPCKIELIKLGEI